MISTAAVRNSAEQGNSEMAKRRMKPGGILMTMFYSLIA